MAGQIVLAYSGGLDTSIIIPWLNENYGYDVIAFIADVGQGEDIDAVVRKAYATGAKKAVVKDLREEFLTEYVFPTLRAGAVYEHKYLLGTSIARPVIAKHQVELALAEGAAALAHGCTGKGNDQFRIEFALRALIPHAVVHAPIREKNLTRSWEVDYAQKNNVPIKQSLEKIWSVDENLWGRSIEGGRLEEPDYPPPEEIFEWTQSALAASATPQTITLEWDRGVPVKLDGTSESPAKLIQKLNKVAGAHGIGRIDIMEDRMLGLKVRENYECPAATVLLNAHRALEALVLTREQRQFKKKVDDKWSSLAYQGLWFDPLKTALECFINKSAERMSGTVSLNLYKGNVSIVGRSSPWALYSQDWASFDSTSYDQNESTGSVKNFGLQSRMFNHLAGAP
jgi:argininosuccinate synthase